MEIKKTVKKPTEVLKDVICDMCSKSCKSDGIDNFEYMDLEAQWGYGSKHDMEFWSAQICETCVMEKLAPDIRFQIL